MQKINVVILFTLFLSVTLHAHELKPHDKSSRFSASEYLVNQDSCFSKQMSTYDSWINSIKDRNKTADITALKAFASEEKYNHYKNRLDCYLFTYVVDGIRVKGYVVKPKQHAALVQNPVIIFNRGGNNVRAHTLNFSSLFHYHMPLADKGYIVISSQYRGADIWPKDIKFDTGRDEFGGKDLDDVMGLYPIIQGMVDADVSRIGMFGWSRGGMMTYLALKRSAWVKAAAVGGAPTDLIGQSTTRPEMEKHVFSRLIPNYSTNKIQELENRSALYWVDKLPRNVPLLILHGGADKSVLPSDASRMANKLEQLDMPYKLLLVPGASHGIREQWDLVLSEVTNWFDTYL